MKIEKGLIIDEPWISKTLSGEKVWEMRSKQTNLRGWIALIRKGSGRIVGVANLAGVSGPYDVEALSQTEDKHCIESDIYSDIDYKWWYAWELHDTRVLQDPIPYQHKSGAVIWVNLDSDVTHALAKQLNDASKRDVIETDSLYPRPVELRITLTQGNIKNWHFYIPRQTDMFPSDAWGGKNKSEAGRLVKLDIAGLDYSIESDIDSSKRILRNRGAIKAFFKLNRLSAGDEIKISKIDEYKFQLSVA